MAIALRPLCAALLLSLHVLAPLRASADEIDGQTDPRFQLALAEWLDDDDAASLPVFAALAAEGNRAAQVMLGLIEVETRCTAPGWPGSRAPSGAP